MSGGLNWRRGALTLALMALGMAIGAAPGLAQVIVLSSTKPDLKAGRMLTGAARITLPEGTTATIVLPSGETREITGPTDTTAEALTRGVQADPAVLNWRIKRI